MLKWKIAINKMSQLPNLDYKCAWSDIKAYYDVKGRGKGDGLAHYAYCKCRAYQNIDGLVQERRDSSALAM